MPRKPKQAYCNFKKYLEEQHPEFHELLEMACVNFSTRGTTGVTIFLPHEQTVKDLLQKTETENPANLEKVTDIVSNHVIKILCRTGPDVKNNKDVFVNAEGFLIGVKSTTADSVTFDNGLVAKASSFNDASKSKKFAVWQMQAPGTITNTGKKIDLSKLRAHKKNSKGAKVGGGLADIKYEETQTVRFNVAHLVESCHKVCISIGKQHPCSYICALVSLCNYVADKHPNAFKNQVLPNLVFHQYGFYKLVQPYCGKHVNRNVSDNIIAEWASTYTMFSKPTKEDLEKFKKNTINCNTSLVKNVDELLNAAQTQPDNISMNGNRIVTDILECYKSANQNAHGAFDLASDELFYCFCKNWNNGASNNLTKFNNLIDLVVDYQYKGHLSLVNDGVLKYIIRPTEHIDQIKEFMDTCAFLYVPLCRNDLKKINNDNLKANYEGCLKAFENSLNHCIQ